MNTIRCVVSLSTLLVSGACTDFNVPDYNKTSLQDLQSKLSLNRNQAQAIITGRGNGGANLTSIADLIDAHLL